MSPRLLSILALLITLGTLRTGARNEPPGWRTPTPLPQTGYATYYSPGVMDTVLAYRLRVGDVQPCGECVGVIALLRAGDIGRKVWLEHDGVVIGPLLVIDCATPWDYTRLAGTAWVVDVSYTQAALWGMTGGARVTVLDRRPVDRKRGAAAAGR